MTKQDSSQIIQFNKANLGTLSTALVIDRIGSSALLSCRDAEILNWILAGKSDRQIGDILGLSGKTINYHVEKLKDRFAVATRIQLVAACLHFGCLTWAPEHLVRQPAS